MDSDKYSTSNCAKLAPHIYDATAKGRSALLAKRLTPLCLVAKRTRRAVTFRLATPKSNSHKRGYIRGRWPRRWAVPTPRLCGSRSIGDPFFSKLKNVGAGSVSVRGR